jgi:hypothetical protein
MPNWQPLFVLPNLLVKEPVEVEFLALVSPDDPRGSIAPTEKPEIDTPAALRLSQGGNTTLNKSTATDSKSLRLSTELGIVRLRVINSKSANFTFRVTVRPRVPLSSQCRQTLPMSSFGGASPSQVD